MSALVFGYTVYGMAGLRPGAEAVLKAGLINTLMYLIASQVLHCCAVIAPNQDVAFMLSILWTTIQLLLSGFFVNFPDVRRRSLFLVVVSARAAQLRRGLGHRGWPKPHQPPTPPPPPHAQVLLSWITYLRYLSAMFYAFEANGSGARPRFGSLVVVLLRCCVVWYGSGVAAGCVFVCVSGRRPRERNTRS